MSEIRSRTRTRRVLLQGIALCYAIAFVSLAVQIEGLYGSRGILPASSWLEWLGKRFGAEAWWQAPSIFWWTGASDTVLVAVCWAGAAASVLLMLGRWPTLMAFVCWALYLSLFQIGRVFLGFQWDILLLEAGFLAIFLAPLRTRMHSAYDPEPSPVVIWLYRWLLFRLMFASGMVKLLSDDPVWWNLTALEYHYWTQPLPTFTAWAANQLPPIVQRFSTLLMFVIELGVPWFIFGPRVLRQTAFVLFVGLQVAIAATGNYTFFNLLTIVLCYSLLDDEMFDAARARFRREETVRGQWPGEPRRLTLPRSAQILLSTLLALPLATAGGAMMVARFGRSDLIPPPVTTFMQWIDPFQLTSSYGLFARMTTQRYEVVLEGSEDGQNWKEYYFRWKPGRPDKAPMFVAPHQPRLDWQMWFAALGDPRSNSWLLELQRRILQGSPPVMSLIGHDPFGGKPPRHIRAMLYEYRPTDFETFHETGAWWRRAFIRPWSAPMSRG